MLIRTLPVVTTWLPSNLASLKLHCQSDEVSQDEDVYASIEELQHFLAHHNNSLVNLSVDCGGGNHWKPQQLDALWTFLSPGTTWLQTLRVLNLKDQAVRYGDMETFANASQMRELGLSNVCLENEFSREGWVAISNRIGGRLESLQLVTLMNITDNITRYHGAGPYLDNDSLLAVCRNLLDSVPSHRFAICEVWDGGIITKLDPALDE